LAAVAQLDYRPNAVAQALRGSRIHSLGLLLPDRGNPYFAELAEAVEDAAFQQGYVLLVGNAMGDEERGTSYLRTFVDHEVDALFTIPGHRELELAAVAAAGIRSSRASGPHICGRC
jgi:LacI family transcriptional regulator